MKFLSLFYLVLFFSPVFIQGATLKTSKLPKFKINGKVTVPVPQSKSPGLDLCPFCVDMMGQIINQLLNILLQVGVVGTCQELCSYLPDAVEQVGCDLICDYVGIEAFIDFINYEDPDPIYLCQLFDMCPVVNGGAVTITKCYVTPPKGPQGTTFTLGMNYVVVNATGTGLITNLVLPPDGFPLVGADFTEGQSPGPYHVEWTLDSNPSENESFGPGKYEVDFAVCAGDCTTSHPWGGVYAQATVYFNITG